MADPLAEVEIALRDRAMTYPEATEEFPWGHRAVKVKGKLFVILAMNDGVLSVTMKLPDSDAYALMQRYAQPTGYGLGKSGWVTCTFRPGDDVPMDLLDEWIDESYRAVASKKLVLALNAQLGGAETPQMVVAVAKKPTPKAAPALVAKKPAAPKLPAKKPKAAKKPAKKKR